MTKSKQTENHTPTPTPWKILAGTIITAEKNGDFIIVASTPNTKEFDAKHGDMFWETRANADYIVEACNSHAALLKRNEELEAILQGIENYASFCKGTDIERVLFLAKQRQSLLASEGEVKL